MSKEIKFSNIDINQNMSANAEEKVVLTNDRIELKEDAGAEEVNQFLMIHAQNSMPELEKKNSLSRDILEMVEYFSKRESGETKMTKSAYKALRLGAANYLADLFENSQSYIEYNRRVTILPKDMRNAIQDRKEVAVKKYKQIHETSSLVAQITENQLQELLPVPYLVQNMIIEPHILNVCPPNESELLEVAVAEKYTPVIRENLAVSNPRFEDFDDANEIDLAIVSFA